MDLTEDLFHDMCTSVEPEFEMPDEVCEIDNSLDHAVPFEMSDSESGDDNLYDVDTSFVSEVSSGSLYLPTPQKLAKQSLPIVPMPKKICFMDLTSLDNFIEQLNQIRKCTTPGCDGKIVPMSIESIGLGGAINIRYTCSGCVMKYAQLEASSKYDGVGSMTEIGMAVQVAFIIAGCTHTTYFKTLKGALGIDAVCPQIFQYTIEMMYPVVKGMLNAMCDEAKKEMRSMDQTQLGSWTRAVTCADGVWMTRGFHSKNATFSIRNYFNGALLYYKHLCQRGRDSIIKEELYHGTSKVAEGYAAKCTFGEAKKEGIGIEVHWQDADSSSSNAVRVHFPAAKVTICGGHAGRAHKKQLEKLAKMRSFSEDFKRKHCEKFPTVNEVSCCCPNRHFPGCGCMSEAFIAQARNNYSSVLSEADSAERFVERLLVLARHARNEHKWDGGQCDFHPLKICSCGKCNNTDELECKGKPYSTKSVLSCPLHSLAYEIELNERASMANDLVHPVLKRGHSNWLEASHSVLIRFRPEHISLERLHYEVSTNLGLLQSNMTYMYEKWGPTYHWVPELYRQLKLPLYDGLQEHLEIQNRKRKEHLDFQKTEQQKKRRIELKKMRTIDAQRRKEWSKKHGQDTYGDVSENSLVNTNARNSGNASGSRCKCGSTTHKRTSHKECPYNKTKVSALAVPSELTVGEHAVEDSSLQGCTGMSTPMMITKDDHKIRTQKSDFAVGDYVSIHHKSLDKQHIPCRIVQVMREKFRLYCSKGIVSGSFSRSDLLCLDSDWYVSLNGWRTAAQVSLRDICTDHSCLEPCGCILGMSIKDSIPVVVESTSDVVTESCNWVCISLYNLTFVNREEVLSASGWLSDAVIESAQLLILQQFPHMAGLQAPILQQAQAFQVHRGEFVQIIHVRDSHWCTVSNVGCNDGVVNVYDSLYPSVSADTIRLIASLVFSSASQLVIQMMGVG